MSMYNSPFISSIQYQCHSVYLPHNLSCLCPFLSLLALELVLLHSESHLEELLLLLGVRRLETSGHRRAGVAASVHDMLAVVVLSVVEQGLNTRLGEAPGTSVERLLLGPDDGLGVGVLVKVLLELLPGEGVQLLNAGEGDVVNVVLGTVLVESSPDLTTAENDSVNLLTRLENASLVLRVGDNPLEASVLTSELFNVATGQRVSEQGLGEEDDES